MNSNALNLASARLGAKTVFSTDDFFADMSRMISDSAPVFIDDKYDDNGKWMDGWESRRKRGNGYDYCVVSLFGPGKLDEIHIDTSHFTGNFAPSASIDACYSDAETPGEQQEWVQIVSVTELQGDQLQVCNVSDDAVYTHIRLNIFPDGGVARLRVYGTPVVNWETLANDNNPIEVSSSLLGARALVCSDEHFGVMQNLLAPGRGANMGDGWETRRRRTPGYDWVIIALARAATITSIEIDTCHFKGNYPDSCNITGMYLPEVAESAVASQSLFWDDILPKQKLQADKQHFFTNELQVNGIVSHICLNIYPDGGISRLRITGTV